MCPPSEQQTVSSSAAPRPQRNAFSLQRVRFQRSPLPFLCAESAVGPGDRRRELFDLPEKKAVAQTATPRPDRALHRRRGNGVCLQRPRERGRVRRQGGLCECAGLGEGGKYGSAGRNWRAGSGNEPKGTLGTRPRHPSSFPSARSPRVRINVGSQGAALEGLRLSPQLGVVSLRARE